MIIINKKEISAWSGHFFKIENILKIIFKSNYQFTCVCFILTSVPNLLELGRWLK